MASDTHGTHHRRNTRIKPPIGEAVVKTDDVIISKYPGKDQTFVIRVMARDLLEEDLLARVKETIDTFIESGKKPGEKRRFIVDFSNVDHLSSKYLEYLAIELKNKLRGKGEELVHAAIDPQIYEVYVITSLNQYVKIAETVADAAELDFGRGR